jgi:hypothetical protein
MGPDHPLLQFFDYDHLPPHLQRVSQPFRELAVKMCAEFAGSELDAGMRKLLEAKDCMVRAAL